MHHAELVAGVSGRVAEIGAGTGNLLSHYPATVTELLAIEPDLGSCRAAVLTSAVLPFPSPSSTGMRSSFRSRRVLRMWSSAARYCAQSPSRPAFSPISGGCFVNRTVSCESTNMCWRPDHWDVLFNGPWTGLDGRPCSVGATPRETPAARLTAPDSSGNANHRVWQASMPLTWPTGPHALGTAR
jgi:hypothetical protein